MEELARRAVACKGWRWKGGELAHVGRNPVRVNDAIAKTWNRTLDQGAHLPLPDLTDAATLGCLLALVREAYRLRLWLASSRDGDMWYVDAASGALAHGKTEGEALVTALEAAP